MNDNAGGHDSPMNMGCVKTRRAACWLTWLMVGCEGGMALPEELDPDPVEADSGDSTPEPEVALPAELPPAVPWRPVGERTVDELGETDWVSLPFPAGQRYVAVRTIPLDGDPEAETRACHRVIEARLASGASLLPADDQTALDQHQRLLPGPGGGVFVLSTTEAPLADADTLELRVGLEDCALGIPASRARFPGMPRTLRVDTAWEPAPEGPPLDATVAVRLARAEDSGWGSRADDPALARAWEVAAERFADVGITLELEAEALVPATGVLGYEADMLALDGLLQQVRTHLQGDPDDARFVPVALVRCLELDDPAHGTRMRPVGQATRIPGSLADVHTPSLVVLASGDCDVSSEPTPRLDPDRYGIVLAHELGHYLGLLHDDHDGAHLAGNDEQRLMRSTLAQSVDTDQAWFSPAQGTVLRRHPDVVLGR